MLVALEAIIGSVHRAIPETLSALRRGEKSNDTKLG